MQESGQLGRVRSGQLVNVRAKGQNRNVSSSYKIHSKNTYMLSFANR